MDNISNVSSEEELLQLRNEGKISEDEYEGLHSAMRKSSKLAAEPPATAADTAKSKRKLGKVAFYLMLAGIVLTVVCFLIFEYPTLRPDIGPWLLFVGCPFEIAAFTMGVIAWPDAFAKATVVTISFITVLAFLFASLTIA